MDEKKVEALAQRNKEVVDTIKPFLADETPNVQGFVIAELLAIYIAGFNPLVRQKTLDLVLNTARDLMEQYDRWGEDGHPDNSYTQ